MTVDKIDTWIYKTSVDNADRLAPKYKLTIPFYSNAFDFINLPKILRSNAVLQNLPANKDKYDIPMVVHIISEPIRATTKLEQFLSGLDLKELDQDTNTTPCHCHEFDPSYVNQHHSHITQAPTSLL